MTHPETPARPPVARWRIAAAVTVLAGLVFFSALFAPTCIRNLELQSHITGIARTAGNQARSDEALREAVLDKARELSLPVNPDNVRIARSADGFRIDVRYAVRFTVPGYTVDLHFEPAAASK